MEGIRVILEENTPASLGIGLGGVGASTGVDGIYAERVNNEDGDRHRPCSLTATFMNS